MDDALDYSRLCLFIRFAAFEHVSVRQGRVQGNNYFHLKRLDNSIGG